MKIRHFLLAAAVLFSVPVFAQVNVSVAGKRGDDTVVFSGFTGSEDMKKQVARDLSSCGWFEVMQSGVSNYIVTGSGTATSVKLELRDGANAVLATFNATGATTAEASHRAMDALLKKLYDVRGLCTSRIAFVAEIAPLVKEIYICDYDGSNLKKVTKNNGLSLEPVWTPGGKTLIYGYIGKSFTNLMEANPANGLSRQLASFRGLNAGGAVSPDGTKIAMVLSKDNQVDLYVRALNGGPLTRLTNDKAVEASPCWSPDGRTICYVSDASAGRPRLRIIPAGGGAAKDVAGLLGSERVSPSWSRDGKIVYSGRLGSYSICVADIAGSSSGPTSRQMLGEVMKGGNWESPSWAPDNRHVVCASGNTIRVLDTWTGKQRTIVNGKSKCSLPDWSDPLP